MEILKPITVLTSCEVFKKNFQEFLQVWNQSRHIWLFVEKKCGSKVFKVFFVAISYPAYAGLECKIQ